MNNSKPTSDLEKFESIWPSYWLEDDFRSKTLSQIIKDFWLSGIILNLEDLQKYKTLDSLADYLNKTIRDNPRPQLLYIVDLKEKSYDNMGLAIIQRIAYKVFLRKHFSGQ
ncbi:MAG: hypothetical protein CBB76_05245 [Crocinitomicaceae bacterium TMED16]|nr:MAG: hypothetical protein CBB76_05245 [Crocinitomicaceae bacterium TMED16]